MEPNSPSAEKAAEKAPAPLTRVGTSASDVNLLLRVNRVGADAHDRYDYFREEDDEDDDDDDDDYDEDDDADNVVCEVVSDDEGGCSGATQQQRSPEGKAQHQHLSSSTAAVSPEEADSRSARPTFTFSKRSVSGNLEGKSPRAMGHGLGIQRTKAFSGAHPLGFAGGGDRAKSAAARNRGAGGEGGGGGGASDDDVPRQQAELSAALASEDDEDDDDEEPASEHTDTNETDDVNTEDFDQEDLSDDEKDLRHTFSDGNLLATEGPHFAATAGSSSSGVMTRARRGVVLESPEGLIPAGSALLPGEADVASPKARGGVNSTKAMKLLGLQERADAATDRFNNAAPFDLLDGLKKKRGSKIKLMAGDKMKMRRGTKPPSRLAARSQSDTTLDVIERGENGSPLQRVKQSGNNNNKSPAPVKKKNMRTSLRSQFSIESRLGEGQGKPGANVDDAPHVRKVVGTVEELIGLLFDAQHTEADKDYESDFFYLYRSFIKPKTLLKKLTEMYSKRELPAGASAERIAEVENERYRNKRVLELIQRWTRQGFNDLNEDANFMQKLTFFINNVLSPQERTESKINAELTQLIEGKNAVYKKQKEDEELAKARFIPLKPDQCHRVKKIARRLNFLEQRTKEIVEEMTYIERSLFVAIQPWEFLAVLWNASPPTPDEVKRQQNYTQWEEHKRRLENWVVSEILTRPDLTERTLTLKKFIDIARFAYKNGNLNCVHTIITALSSPPVKRLARTWSNLPSKAAASYEKLSSRVLAGEQTDYQAYTLLLKDGRTLPFLLPSLSVFTREISLLKEAKREDPGGDKAKTVVDFTLLRRAMVVMHEIQGYQQRGSPALTSRPVLNKFLRQQHRSLPDNVICYFSLHCEAEEDGASREIRIDSLDPGLVYAINNGRFFVKAGTPEALSTKVLDTWINSLDPDFRDAVILCRSYWISAVDLFKRLISCYPLEAVTDMWGDFKEPDVRLPDVQERLRTVDALRFWMEVELHELRHDPAFRQQLGDFVKSAFFINSNEASFFLHLHETFNPVRPPVPAAALPAIAHSVPGFGEATTTTTTTAEYPLEDKLLTKTFPRELAECLTTIDQVMLKAIPPKELVRKAYTKPEKSPNMASMVNHFNSISNWVASVIVLEPNQQRRAQLLVQFMLAAWECRLIQNFNGSYAIVAALNNAAISRLKQTWALVPARALARWKELEFLFDFPGAFRNYREAIAKTKPPVIPFLANYSKNLFGIEENNLVYISDGIVNFERFVMLVSQIRDLQTYQQYSYSFTVDPALYDYLVEGKNKMILSEDECYEQSQEREGKPGASNSDGESLSAGSTPTASPVNSPVPTPRASASSPPTSSSMSSSPSTPDPSSPLSSPAGNSARLTRSPSSPIATNNRMSVAMGSPLFARTNSKLGRSSSLMTEEQADTVKRTNPLFGARLPAGSPTPARRSTDTQT